MITTLALRNVAHRPFRSVFLFAGYGTGVAVMIVLLSIGEALITQASDERLVGGGEVTVLPAGLDVEVMKTGGLGGLFFSIDHAQFVYRQLLAAPRLAGDVRAVAPQIEGKLAYLRLEDGRELPVRATGEIPSQTRAVGAMPLITDGAWSDDDGDRRWRNPSPRELHNEIDHFHLPPPDAPARESWAEWHYFNVLSANHSRWAFISFIVAGDVGRGRWGGQVVVTVRDQAGTGRSRKFTSYAPGERVRLSTEQADLSLGETTVRVLSDGRYALHGRAREEGGADQLTMELIVSPAPNAYFPGASLGSGNVVSGYAVAGLRAEATGTICIARRCERYERAQSYHDHNWGLWRGVTWEWGATRAGPYTVLYGRVEAPDSLSTTPPIFVYVVDSLGFRALFRPQRISYVDGRKISIGGCTVHVPSRAIMADARGADTLRLELAIEDAIATDMRRVSPERGEQRSDRAIARPYFVQMKGVAHLSGRIGGSPVEGRGAGFFETYR
ncbi:MAG: hypothetical protein NVS1B4_02900 [Gemmatimonadaceae bacterium]